jgi:DTW domain-containing protein YfiP
MVEAETSSLCARCGKPRDLCVCDRIVEHDSRTRVLILQHPQEMDVSLGTARITALSLPRAVTVRPGLSWASLAHALERDDVDPKRWAILFPHSLPRELTPSEKLEPLLVLDRKGERVELEASPLEGIVILDGTWSQAKTLWWRNPWMLKLPRLVLHPKEPSAYGKVRKQPQRGFLSTLEAVGETLDALGEDPAILKSLKRTFRTLLQRVRSTR